jgi:hypothetical protein
MTISPSKSVDSDVLLRNLHACKTATMFGKNDYGGGPVLCQGSEKGPEPIAK